MSAFYIRYFFSIGLLIIAFIPASSFGQANKFDVDSIKALVGKLSSDTEKVKTYIDKAQAMNCNDSTNKIIIAKEAKKLAQSIEWRQGVLNANRMLGQVYFDCQKNYVKSFESLEDNVSLSKNAGDSLNEAIALETIAKFHQQISQYQEALAFYLRALELRPPLDFQMGVLGDMGVVYNKIGDNAQALTFYDSSLSLVDKKDQKDHYDSLQEAALLVNIGDIYLATSQSAKALENYRKVEEIGITMDNMPYQIRGLTGIGKTYELNSDYKNAIQNYRNALQKCYDINDFKDEVMITNELANTYLETFDFKKALELSDSSIWLAENQNFTNLLSKSYTTLGNIYIRQNKYDLAVPNLQKSLSISQKTGVLDDQKDAWFALSTAYKHNGHFAEALEAFEHFTTIRDSQNNVARENASIRKDLEANFKNQQFADSLKTATAYGEKINRQKKITYTGFVGLLMVMLLAFFIYRNYKIQKKYNNLLSKEKMGHLAHIEAQSNVLSDIAHIQAHHVRGPVATILGLVSLFNFEDPTDPVNKEVIDGLSIVTEKLDNVIKDVIIKENKLRYGKDE
jgi:tetratricopeptide (TPR) repeat protein